MLCCWAGGLAEGSANLLPAASPGGWPSPFGLETGVSHTGQRLSLRWRGRGLRPHRGEEATAWPLPAQLGPGDSGSPTGRVERKSGGWFRHRRSPVGELARQSPRARPRAGLAWEADRSLDGWWPRGWRRQGAAFQAGPGRHSHPSRCARARLSLYRGPSTVTLPGGHPVTEPDPEQAGPAAARWPLHHQLPEGEAGTGVDVSRHCPAGKEEVPPAQPGTLGARHWPAGGWGWDPSPMCQGGCAGRRHKQPRG